MGWNGGEQEGRQAKWGKSVLFSGGEWEAGTWLQTVTMMRVEVMEAAGTTRGHNCRRINQKAMKLCCHHRYLTDRWGRDGRDLNAAMLIAADERRMGESGLCSALDRIQENTGRDRKTLAGNLDLDTRGRCFRFVNLEIICEVKWEKRCKLRCEQFETYLKRCCYFCKNIRDLYN